MIFTLDVETEIAAVDIDDVVAGDYGEITVQVDGLEEDDQLAQAAFTAKVDLGDTDSATTTVQRIVNGAVSLAEAEGIFTVPGVPRRRKVVFRLTPANTTKLLTSHYYDIRFWIVRDGATLYRSMKVGTIVANAGATSLTQIVFMGGAESTVGAIEVAGVGGQTFLATSASTVGPVASAGTGGQTFLAAGGSTVGPVASAAAGNNGIAFTYVPGDNIVAKGGTFARTGTSPYWDASGVLQSAATGVARDGHYLASERHLLLENGATNIVPSSKVIQGANAFGATVTTDATTAPDGTVTGDRLVETAITDVHQCSVSFSGTLTDNADYVWSTCMKADQRTILIIQITDKANVTRRAWFNTSTGLFGTVNAGLTTYVAGSFSQGFYRVGVKFNASSGGTTPVVSIALASADNVSTYAGNTANGAYFWGHQLQLGTKMSSLITTTGSTASTGSDSLSFAGVAVTGTYTLYQRYRDIGDTTRQDSVATYTSGAAIALTLDRAYTHVAILAGNLTAVQCRAILGTT